MPKFVTLTGHRDVDEVSASLAIRQQLEWLKGQWGNHLYARWGGAAGADTIFAEVCISLGIQMDLYLPDPYYEKRSIKQPWKPRYKYAKEYSVNVYFAAEDNNWKNNFKRNEFMIAGCSFVLAAYYHDDIEKYTPNFRPRKGGTAHGIQTALKMGYKLGETLIHLPVNKAQLPLPPVDDNF